MAGDLSELVQLLVHTGSYHVSLTQLGCGFRMHGLAQVFKKFCAIAHLRDQLVQRLDALS